MKVTPSTRKVLVARYVGPVSGLLKALQMDAYYIRERILLEKYEVHKPAPLHPIFQSEGKFARDWITSGNGHEMTADRMHALLSRQPNERMKRG